MVMAHRVERALYHDILKVLRAIKAGHLDLQALNHTKVPSFPCNFFFWAE